MPPPPPARATRTALLRAAVSMAARRNPLLVGVPASRRRQLHATPSRGDVTPFAMPAMSPTMTEGGVAAWKLKEGDSFSAGDVLLEIETDKATMDVEAQEDGVLAKVVVQDGAKNVAVGKLIAMLAEQGDDISNVVVPKEEEQQQQQKQQEAPAAAAQSAPSAATTPAPPKPSSAASHTSTHAAAAATAAATGPRVFPSVSRLLVERNVAPADVARIRGTGVRGMLTKGDVLAFLGDVATPEASAAPLVEDAKGGLSRIVGRAGAAAAAAKRGARAPPRSSELLTEQSLRSLILSGLATREAAPAAAAAAAAASPPMRAVLDEMLARYPPAKGGKKAPAAAAPTTPGRRAPSSSSSSSALAGLL